ncbi:MAG: cysteine synthase family protein [Acidobacteriota bacterium]
MRQAPVTAACLAEALERLPLVGLIGHTPLLPIRFFEAEAPGSEIFAKAEWLNPGGSLKDRPVLRMLTEALRQAELRPGMTILDSSSGNAGIAYAMLGAALGYAVELVVPNNASLERKQRILAHGARLVHTDPIEGYDAALREVHRLHEAEPDRYFFCDQYANDNNWRAHYEGTAAEILDQTGGRLTHFVAGVGTGGTLTGVGRRLKEHDRNIQIVCVQPDRFPSIEGLKPLGSPGDIVPKILDQTVIDEWLPIGAEDAYRMCSRLAGHGFFVGQSSGAFLAGALAVARRGKKARVVTLFPDLGERYFSTRLWACD